MQILPVSFSSDFSGSLIVMRLLSVGFVFAGARILNISST